MGEGGPVLARGGGVVSRVVWLEGGFVAPEAAALSIDDPGVRWGEGLFETMRGQDGHVPWLDRHLARLERSTRVLGLAPTPDPRAVRDAVGQVAERLGQGASRIRLTVTPHPTVLVEGEPLIIDPAHAFRAIAIRGAWHPGRSEAEHKTLSWLGWRRAQRAAEERAADVALLLDAEGRLGEGSTVNVFCVIGGELVTAPAWGLLPGIARAAVMELLQVREESPAEADWRDAEEMFATSAVRGVVPITACDDRTVGSGHAGPITARVRTAVADMLTG